MINVITEITKIGQEIAEIDIVLEHINKIGKVMSEESDKTFNLYIEELLVNEEKTPIEFKTMSDGNNEVYLVQGNPQQLPGLLTSLFQPHLKTNITKPLSLDLDLGNTVLLKILDVIKNEYSEKRKKLIKKLEKFGIKEDN